MDRTLAFFAACVAVVAAASDGITLKVYNNQGLFGTPASTKVLDSTSFSLPGTAPFSAELVGTVSFPPEGGVYHFDCNMTKGTMGYVWVDGHMICQDSITYKPGAGSTDNPLPVNAFKNLSKGVVKELPFRAHLYYSGHVAQPQICDVSSAGVFDDAHHQCGFKDGGVFQKTNSWDNAAKVCTAGGYSVAGAQASMGQEVWCGNTLTPNCPKVPKPQGISTCPGNRSETCGGSYLLEVLKLDCHPDPHPAPPPSVGLSVRWAPMQHGSTADPSPGSFRDIPRASLSPALPEAEAKRDAMQRALAVGWGPWLHSNMLAIVKLPEAATITTKLCKKSSGECITGAVPDGARPHPGNRPGVETRVGLHAYDRSYVQFYFGGDNHNIHANVSVEYSVSGDNNADIDLLVTPIGNCGSSCADYELVLGGRYAWFKAGNVSLGAGSLQFAPAGMPAFALHPTAAATPFKGPGTGLAVSLGDGAVGFSTSSQPSASAIAAKLKAGREAELKLLQHTFGWDRMFEGQAVKASAMWTMVSTPAENGGAPFMPVSRVWSFTPGAVNQDFTYAIFDWDNFFATLLAASGGSNSSVDGFGGFGFAASNLFQVAKSKTAAGFVPNFAAGGLRSQDRTEPPIGAKVTLDIVHKFGAANAKWVAEVVFDDLLDWNDWFIRKRLKPPLNMVALGTYNDQNHRAGNMQDARYESGLDNSPMYDGTFVNTTNGCSLYESGCGLMQLYDVGMTSMWVQEAFALAELADIIGRPKALSDMLLARGKAMAQKISDHLWDDNLGIFVNRFSADHNNGTFYEHVSPTSFYALQAHAATDAQAASMAENWMMNSSRFCVSPKGDYDGLADSCYWGLPSIEASDPAYPRLGYWRGYIWGPMVQLTFWSLQNYDHVPQVQKARKALCKQAAGLMMSQWNQHRHICENYNPHKTADTTGGDCSGTRFYHWGALTGVIGLMEDGLF